MSTANLCKRAQPLYADGRQHLFRGSVDVDTELKTHQDKGDTVSEMTHKPKSVFAVEAETSDADLRRNLAAYRRLTANQRGAYAAELKRKVEIEIEIAEKRRPSRRHQKDGSLFRVKSALMAFMRSVVRRIGSSRPAPILGRSGVLGCSSKRAGDVRYD
jgi:hypothetical protein